MNLRTFDRRQFFRLAGGVGVAGAGSLLGACRRDTPTGAEAPAPPRLARYPEKSELILLTDRPPQLETPLHYFQQDVTPNEAFFVRWHLEGIPTSVDLTDFRLQVGGHVQKPLQLTVDDLRTQFTPVSLLAVNQCSGNARSLFEPRVPGGQWKQGAIGNALWTGVRLKDILERAGVKAGAVDVTLQGLDRSPLPTTADFVKSLDVGHALDGEVVVAYEMNGVPPPMLNGFPLRLVVPGWYATYWVKSLEKIDVLPHKYDGFWMTKAYTIPNNHDGVESHDHLAKDLVPISRFSIHSIFVRPEPETVLTAGKLYVLEGLALDSGYGIRRVEVSPDGGQIWADARLDPELGKYSWRRWRMDWTPSKPGKNRLLVRAANAVGDKQMTGQWNHGGYMRKEIEHVDVHVV